MRLLLFIIGFLALASGGMKFQDRVRSRIGTSVLAAGELALGIAACLVGAIVAGPSKIHVAMVVASTLGIVVASLHQMRLTTDFHQRRELSESHRLRRFVDAPLPGNARLTTGAIDDRR